MKIKILSLFPRYFEGPFDVSIIKKAKEKNIISIDIVDIRDFSEGKHKIVDDRPYGGGPGMVLKAEPILKAIKSVKTDKSHIIYLSPQGTKFNSKKAEELSKFDDLILICGCYEGVDERIIESIIDEEISIGDYVLTNGNAAAAVLLDAIVRFIPNILGNKDSLLFDSFNDKYFGYPQYTRPENFNGKKVPQVLLSGNHLEIKNWRVKKAKEKTLKVRPDLRS